MKYQITAESDEMMVVIPMKDYTRLIKMESNVRGMEDEISMLEGKNEMITDKLTEAEHERDSNDSLWRFISDQRDKLLEYLRLKYNDDRKDDIPTRDELNAIKAIKESGNNANGKPV